MNKVCLIVTMMVCASLTTVVYGFDNKTTTLKNGDSETYEYSIRTAGGEIVSDDGALNDNRVEYSTGVRYGKIHADSTAYICKHGCDLTLTKTGQTITVQPGDRIVIDRGVMSVQ